MELTNEPEQEWLKAVNLLGGKKSYFMITDHTVLAKNSQPQPPVGSKKVSLMREKKSTAGVASLQQGEGASFSF